MLQKHSEDTCQNVLFCQYPENVKILLFDDKIIILPKWTKLLLCKPLRAMFHTAIPLGEF